MSSQSVAWKKELTSKTGRMIEILSMNLLGFGRRMIQVSVYFSEDISQARPTRESHSVMSEYYTVINSYK